MVVVGDGIPGSGDGWKKARRMFSKLSSGLSASECGAELGDGSGNGEEKLEFQVINWLQWGKGEGKIQRDRNIDHECEQLIFI